MKEIGLNKRLYDRRIELGYSVKEACIRLDISKLKLSLIENGYKKVKDKKLQVKFIFKYKLEENFFEQSELEYPSPLTSEEDEEDVSEYKIVKLFKKLPFKIALIALTLGSIAMFSIGITRYANLTEKDCFSEKYNAVADYAKENGKHHLGVQAQTTKMLLCDYYGIEEEHAVDTEGYFFESLNFMPQYDEYLGYAFFYTKAEVDLTYLAGIDIGPGAVYFESRMNDTSERLHFHVYTFGDLVTPTAHFSVDYNYLNFKFTYNLVEVKDVTGKLNRDDNNSFIASIYKMVFEKMFPSFEAKKEQFMKEKQDILHYSSYDEFKNDQASGLLTYNYVSRTNRALVIAGIVLSTVFFALFILTIIVTTTVGKKVMKAVTIEKDQSIVETQSERKFTPLPKNKLGPPFLPEAVIRIIAFVLMVIGSMSLYYIFEAILNGDIIGTLESLRYRSAVASFTTLGVLLIFFIKMDIIQNKKSNFLLNFILFFAGFIFYIMTLLISSEITSSPALNRFSVVLDFLPGNIVWGILAFNLLTTILLTKPKFKSNVKRNTIIYRCSVILPLGYMIASSVIQIGKKMWGWNLPFAVSSLFFTKALIITAFSILYVLVVYLYRKVIDHKYGKENAETYVLGNRYLYIRNLLIAVIFAVLGVADLFVGKTAWGSRIGFGSNIGMLFLIPVILLYHPHRGSRNKKWDLVFNIAYGFSLLIGIICIISSISVYITSL